MRFVSFRAGGRPRYGLVNGNGIVDLTTRRSEPDLKSLIAADALTAAVKAHGREQPDFALDASSVRSADPESVQDHLHRAQLS